MISMHANLEIARRALQTHQLAMSVIGNNIANINTPGYSRRSSVIRQTNDFETRAGMVGTGVDAIDIRRGRDTVLDGLFRRHNGDAGKWGALDDYLSRVETVLNEPGEGGLSDAMGSFWGSWHDLAKEPDSMAIRAQVVERGQALTESLHRIDSTLRSLQSNLTDEIDGQVTQINAISNRLALLNRTIVEGEVEGHEASALRDERDLLVDQLSEIVDVQVSEEANGSSTILIGSEVLVQGATSRTLELQTGVNSTAFSSNLVWQGSSRDVQMGSGKLRGYLDARDTYIEDFLTNLDSLAANLVSEVNASHSAGYGLDGSTGNDYFDANKTSAASIELDTAVAADFDLLSASATGLPGDGDQALALANLAHTPTMAANSATFGDFYNSLTGTLALHAQEAGSFLATEEVLILDIEGKRMEVSGVSLDEEMTYLLSYQHAYEAMIKVTATIDEMMATLISTI